jgi:membrane protein DedA with SNARE-associated domain
VVVGITIFVYDIREHIRDFAAYGYPGVFIIALLANATVFLPAPGVAVVFAMGSIFNPLGVALAAGTGGALGELSGYLAGFSGQAVIERTDLYERIGPWIDRYGGWGILAFAAIPNPFFDIAGVAAGVAKMPLWRFLFFCWIGQIIKMALFAFAGAYSITWLAGMLR